MFRFVVRLNELFRCSDRRSDHVRLLRRCTSASDSEDVLGRGGRGAPVCPLPLDLPVRLLSSVARIFH